MTSMTPGTHARAAWLFLRLLGLVYLVAFWSLDGQILGLVGADGIVPAGVSDAVLRTVCLSGIALALLLIAGILPMVVLPLLWAAYLWLSTVCGEFLWFQWDALLLETGLLAIFLAPVAWRERLSALTEPPRVVVWLFLWLLFRLMVGSGAVKLTSGDPTWRDLTALTFHFETQPIPTPLAWYAHWLPSSVLKGATLAVFATEMAVPFLILAPRRFRTFAFIPLAGLQALIALTGNYAFFNLLTVALCLFLLDDAALGGWGRVRPDVGHTGRMRSAAAIVVAALTVPVSAARFTRSLGFDLPGAAIIDPLASALSPFRSVNAYGLFAVMTTTRPEIVIEGTEDGRTWKEYEFKYKAGDVHRRPPWVAPHQPRLDWQMWFAALSRFESEPWFQDFCVRLLEADPTVLKLLAHDPFEGRKPASLRAVLYRYRFADRARRSRESVWWVRERLGPYSPELR